MAGPLLPSGSGSPSVPSSKYTGGVITSVLQDVAPTVGVAFEAKGGAGDLKAVATAAVLKSLLNEGREVLPWLNKSSPDLLSSVTPVVQVGGRGAAGVCRSSGTDIGSLCLEALNACLS